MGVIDALGYGSRIVVRRPYLVAVPVLVDLIIWLLPPISTREAITASLEPEYLATQPDNVLGFSEISWLLGFFVPSTGLLAANLEAVGSTIELTTIGSVLSATILLIVGGAILGTMYLVLLANAIEGGKPRFNFMSEIANKSPKLVGLAVGAAAGIMITAAGLVLLAVLLALAASSLPVVIVVLFGLIMLVASLAFIAGMLAAGLVLYFAVVALILEPVSIRDSIRRSISFWRGNLGPGIVFVLLVTLIQWGITFIWLGLSQVTPGLIISVFGSAFIGTGISAGSMVFYVNRLSLPEVAANDPLGA